ncbi:hypothetical protein DRQ53_03735 [bacterium]|nr:MAG: hypothetical protein DRQ53_03735 [bacterium]
MRRVLRASTVLVLVMATTPVQAADADLDAQAAERMRPVVGAAIEFYNEHSEDNLPALGSDQIQELLDGEVVRIRRRPARDQEDPPERVTGYHIIALPRTRVWVAALDPNFQATDMLTERRLQSDPVSGSLWHQYLSLPWPVSDRQWVVRVQVQHELARQTTNLIWELSWDLEAGGEELARESVASGLMGAISEEQASDAVYVPANEGSWILFSLEDEITLVAYRIVARVGGSIPDSWIATFGMAQLTQLLDEVTAHAVQLDDDYDPALEDILGGDGEPIAAW